ncbi:hypothetical protein DKP78_14375 [Enterococcus faecium]|nr:hypothetical protein DKP78_14375 [Enterococcus faecium]
MICITYVIITLQDENAGVCFFFVLYKTYTAGEISVAICLQRGVEGDGRAALVLGGEHSVQHGLDALDSLVQVGADVWAQVFAVDSQGASASLVHQRGQLTCHASDDFDGALQFGISLQGLDVLLDHSGLGAALGEGDYSTLGFLVGVQQPLIEGGLQVFVFVHKLLVRLGDLAQAHGHLECHNKG